MDDFVLQLEQQRSKDVQVEADLADKARRRQLVTSTRDSLSVEREKIRLMVTHFAPKNIDIDRILES